MEQKFEQNSAFKFTYEVKVNEIYFPDIKVSKAGDHVTTMIHVKSTNSGDCINYKIKA